MTTTAPEPDGQPNPIALTARPTVLPREMTSERPSFISLDISVQSGKELLPATHSFRTADTVERGIVFCTGVGANRNGPFAVGLEANLLNEGLVDSTLRFDFHRHSGDLTDLRGFTLTGAVRDVHAAVAELRERGAREVTIVASSFGAQAALLAASEGLSVDRIVCRAPVTDCMMFAVSRVPAEVLEIWKASGEFDFPIAGGKTVKFSYDLVDDLRGRYASTDYSRIVAPVFIVHGEADRDVPYRAMFAASRGIPKLSLVSVPGADHGFSSPEHGAVLDQFLRAAIQGKGTQ